MAGTNRHYFVVTNFKPHFNRIVYIYKMFGEQHSQYLFVAGEILEPESSRKAISSVHHTSYFARKHRIKGENHAQND